MNKTKKTIFESAIKIFSESGYNGATMDDIALASGVAKGTLYYHFKSKEEIFNFIITEGIGILNEEAGKVTVEEEDPLKKLMLFCKVQLELVYRYKDLFKVILSQLWGQELRQLELRKAIRDYIENIESYLIDAMRVGALKEGDTYFMAYTIFGALCSTAVYEVINRETVSIDEVASKLLRYTLYGIAGQ